METERLKNIGRLEETRRKCQQINARLEAVRKQMRNHLDPFERLENIPTNDLAALALEFADLHTEYMGCVATIKKLNAALGR